MWAHFRQICWYLGSCEYSPLCEVVINCKLIAITLPPLSLTLDSGEDLGKGGAGGKAEPPNCPSLNYLGCLEDQEPLWALHQAGIQSPCPPLSVCSVHARGLGCRKNCSLKPICQSRTVSMWSTPNQFNPNLHRLHLIIEWWLIRNQG